ncbi:hypothetical protein JT359_14140 [Candidatus Poribacteria bacterium]|nr:hypothetical protein [Candidatus Poribacteria bacterium]
MFQSVMDKYVVDKSLNPFYTKQIVADLCWNYLKDTLIFVNRTVQQMFFVEPSAGTGAFFQNLPIQRRLGIDIAPMCDQVLKQDFFQLTNLPYSSDKTIIVGNPPFGKRGKLAIAFFNHAAKLADIIAFILPVNFRKYIVHKQLDESMQFIRRLPLPRNAFQLNSGKTYSVNTEFQIWTRVPNTLEDMREHKPLPIRHQDFLLWQYNNTKAALKVFDNTFDFAVPCQGWQDYSRRVTDEKECERNKQWILLKANNKDVLFRLQHLDYGLLARECGTAVPGFRKGDLVKAYSDKFDSYTSG